MVGTIVSEKVDLPSRAWLGLRFAQSCQRNPNFDAPDFCSFIDHDCRFRVRGPFKIFLRQVEFQVQRFTGRSPFKFRVAIDLIRFRSDKCFNHVIVPKAESFLLRRR